MIYRVGVSVENIVRTDEQGRDHITLGWSKVLDLAHPTFESAIEAVIQLAPIYGWYATWTVIEDQEFEQAPFGRDVDGDPIVMPPVTLTHHNAVIWGTPIGRAVEKAIPAAEAAVSALVGVAKVPEPPMRRIKYEMGHAIGGYLPDSAPSYFTNLKHARAAAVAEVRDYLDALNAYDDHGKRYPVGHDHHVSVTKEGEYKWRLSFGMGGSRYVYVSEVTEDLYFDDNGDVFAKESKPEGGVAWVEVDTNY